MRRQAQHFEARHPETGLPPRVEEAETFILTARNDDSLRVGKHRVDLASNFSKGINGRNSRVVCAQRNLILFN